MFAKDTEFARIPLSTSGIIVLMGIPRIVEEY